METIRSIKDVTLDQLRTMYKQLLEQVNELEVILLEQENMQDLNLSNFVSPYTEHIYLIQRFIIEDNRKYLEDACLKLYEYIKVLDKLTDQKVKN